MCTHVTQLNSALIAHVCEFTECMLLPATLVCLYACLCCFTGAKSAASSLVMEVEEVEDFNNDFEVCSTQIVHFKVYRAYTLHFTILASAWL
jgi:hypothetical protein